MLLPTIKKKERTPNIDEEADFWANVLACDDNTDSEYDEMDLYSFMSHVGPLFGVGALPTMILDVVEIRWRR